MAQFFKPAGDKFAGADIPVDLIDLLARLSDDYAIFIGAQFGRQADIIIFSKWAAHVIEVKDKRGTITVDEYDRWFVDGEPIVNWFAGEAESPTVQVRNTAEALRTFLQKCFYERRKHFKGKVFPYVLVPHPSPESRSNLFQRRKERKPWEWVIISLAELPNAIAKRDDRARATVDFAFDEDDIRYIAQRLGMVPADEVIGVRVRPAQEVVSDTGSEKRTTASAVSEWASPRPVATVRTPSRKRLLTKTLLPLIVVTILCCLSILLLAALFAELKTFKGFLAGTPTVPQTTPIIPVSTPTQSLRQPFLLGTSPVPVTVTTFPNLATESTITVVSTPIPTSTLSPTPTPMAGEWSAEKNGLILTVEKVEILDNRFRIWMRATNRTSEMVVLPLFKNFFVVDNLGNQYEADPFSSTFPQDIAPGATVSGYAEMSTVMNRDATFIKVMFAHTYGAFSTSIVIEGIPVR